MTSCRKLGFFTWISPCKKLDQRLAKLYDLTKSEGKSPFFFWTCGNFSAWKIAGDLQKKSFNSLWIDPLENSKNSKSQVELVAIWLWKWGIPRITMINQRICLENIYFQTKPKKKLPQNSIFYAAPTSCWAFSGDTCKTQSGRTNDSWWRRFYSQKWLRDTANICWTNKTQSHDPKHHKRKIPGVHQYDFPIIVLTGKLFFPIRTAPPFSESATRVSSSPGDRTRTSSSG